MPKVPENGHPSENGNVFADPKEKFEAMYSMTEGGHMVTYLERVGQEWRGLLIGILYTHPESFHALIEQLLAAHWDMPKRRAAFVVAAQDVLKHCYEHPMCETLRIGASRAVKVMDSDAFDQYRVVKYAGTNSPDREQRIKAYNLVIARFIELSYTVPGL